MGAYSEIMRMLTARTHEFSQNQPKPAMKIVTKIERVQPYAVGVDEKGEIVWEGREMPDWQKLMFRLRYYGDFIAHWYRKSLEEVAGLEQDGPTSSMTLTTNLKYRRRKRVAHKGD